MTYYTANGGDQTKVPCLRLKINKYIDKLYIYIYLSYNKEYSVSQNCRSNPGNVTMQVGTFVMLEVSETMLTTQYDVISKQVGTKKGKVR